MSLHWPNLIRTCIVAKCKDFSTMTVFGLWPEHMSDAWKGWQELKGGQVFLSMAYGVWDKVAGWKEQASIDIAI